MARQYLVRRCACSSGGIYDAMFAAIRSQRIDGQGRVNITWRDDRNRHTSALNLRKQPIFNSKLLLF